LTRRASKTTVQLTRRTRTAGQEQPDFDGAAAPDCSSAGSASIGTFDAAIRERILAPPYVTQITDYASRMSQPRGHGWGGIQLPYWHRIQENLCDHQTPGCRRPSSQACSFSPKRRSSSPSSGIDAQSTALATSALHRSLRAVAGGATPPSAIRLGWCWRSGIRRAAPGPRVPDSPLISLLLPFGQITPMICPSLSKGKQRPASLIPD
jgi:hypothetical protein